MRQLIFGSLLLVSAFNCQSKQNKVNEKNNNQKQETMQEMPIYTLKISVANPYETYVNDMPLEKYNLKGSTNSELPINDFILKSGIQKVKIVIHPELGNDIVDKGGKDYVNVKIIRYPHGLSNMNPDESILIKEINLKDRPEGPLVTKEVEISADVPYVVAGWMNSVDLTKENQDTLKKEILLKYKYFQELINKGDLIQFMKLNENRDKEVFAAFYDDSNMKQEDIDFMENKLKKSKGYIQPLKDFSYKFYGDGRVVTLEGVNGRTALIASDEEKNYYYQVLLHRPKPGAPLEIIR